MTDQIDNADPTAADPEKISPERLYALYLRHLVDQNASALRDIDPESVTAKLLNARLSPMNQEAFLNSLELMSQAERDSYIRKLAAGYPAESPAVREQAHRRFTARFSDFVGGGPDQGNAR